MTADTIVALASGAGRAGVAVIRLSGPHARAALRAVTHAETPAPRRAELRDFRDETGDLIDRGIALLFASPASFTGEDVAELHAHGGPAVIEALLDACLAVDGVRLAEAGEFTRRAFENGKLDLAQAEGLADLVEAETEGQRRQALAQMGGALGALSEGWRARLIEILALVEAEIDFPDEGLPGGLAASAGPRIEALADELTAALAEARRGERVREGYRIAIVGPPNAGKSSLLNALARREAAIVSDIPGTTRDVVEIRVVLGGFPVWIADTAGLREAADAVEAEGVRRALARAEEADLVLGVAEGGAAPAALLAALGPGDLLIRSKADLVSSPASGGSGREAADGGGRRSPLSHAARDSSPAGGGARERERLSVSAKTGQGLAELEALLEARVRADLAGRAAPALTRVRHARLVAAASEALGRAAQALAAGPELAAEELRAAADALGRLTGRIDVEDVLGEIFASFCIGK